MTLRVLSRRCSRAVAVLPLFVLIACALVGCSMNDGVGSFLIDPGHYSVYHCKDLVARLNALQAREKDLSNLMEQANAGPGGAIIGNLSYRADYENALGEEKVLRRAAAEKQCELLPPAPPLSPAPAAYSPQVPRSTPATAVPAFQSDQTIH